MNRSRAIRLALFLVVLCAAMLWAASGDEDALLRSFLKHLARKLF